MTGVIAAHLDSLIRDERGRALTSLGRLRLGASLLALVLLVDGFRTDSKDVIAAGPYVVLHFCLSLLAILLGRRRSVFLLAWAPFLVDLPLITLAAIASGSFLNPLFTLSSLPAYPMTVVFASLSLDRFIIGVTTLAALAWATILIWSSGCPVDESVVAGIFIVIAGAASVFLVGRIRALVVESRRKDFAGKYVLGRRLGVGGMAEVFEATYSPEGGFERRVAVKRILDAHAEDPRFIDMFRKEASVGAQLAHPNLVQVLDFGRHETSWFIAMEFVDGVPLSAMMRRWAAGEGCPSLSARVLVMQALAEAVAYLHSRVGPSGTVGLVHRDLNPPNVLITKQGEVKISDFGIAQWSSGQVTQAGVVRGKLGYLAPEVKRGQPASVASDIFSLGVVFFELLADHRLSPDFDGAVMEAPLAVLKPDLPSELIALVQDMLEADPVNRIDAAKVLRRVDSVQTSLGSPLPARAELVDAVSRLEVVSPVVDGQSQTQTVSVNIQRAVV